MIRKSEQNWLSFVPNSWTVTKLSHRYSQQLGKMLDQRAAEGPDQAPYLGNKDVRWDYVNVENLATMSFSPAERSKFSLELGDLLVCEGGEIGRTAIWRNEAEGCFFQKAIHRLRPFDRRRDHPRFLYYALFTAAHLGVLADQGNTSTIAHLTGEALRAQRFPFPDGTIQNRVADFLDRKTAAIDALIEKKERMIELLAEKRAALVHRAVTKGLDPSVPMKDSGIPWIGEIPAHWEAVRLGFVSVELQTGPFGAQLKASEYISGAVPVINPANLSAAGLRADSERTISQVAAQRLSRHRLELGDLVFARRGVLGRCNLVGRAEEGWVCGTGSLRVRPNTEFIEPRFLLAFSRLPGVGDWLSEQSVGSTMDNLNTSILGRLPIAVAPMGEQQEIVEYLDSLSRKLDFTSSTLLSQISRLKEYRQALITQAVTGQLDISEEAA